MTILVTGASGHIGLTLIHRLTELGCRVRALARDETHQLADRGVEVVKANICDEASLHPAFRDVEVVYHLAGYISIRMDEWPTLEAINVLGVQNVVKLCKQYHIRRLVHFSSLEVFVDTPPSEPLDETRPLVPADFFLPYARSKALGQRLVIDAANHGLEVVIIYPSAVIGPYDYQFRAANGFLLQVAKGAMPVITSGGYNWVDVRDVVDGAIRAEKQAPPGASYILSNEWVSLRALTVMMHELGGAPIPRFIMPLGFARWLIAPMSSIARLRNSPSLLTEGSVYALGSNRHVSHERATRDLGYKPRPLPETLADTLQWFVAEGFLPARKKTNTPDSADVRDYIL